MPSRTRLVIAAVCLVYVAVRVWRLDDSCLWFDEIFSVHAAGHDWRSLFSFVAKDLIHPPLFYVVLKLWIGVAGESVFWLRMLPVIFSVLAIFPFVRLCRELKLRTSVVLLSLFLLAVNGALIKYTQTVRMYSMLMFLSILSTWLFARYFNRGKSFVPLVITNVLLVYTHYFGWLVIGAEVVAILWMQRIKWRRALVMTGIAAAAFAPWAVSVWQAGRDGSSLAQNIGWQSRPGLYELLTFVTDIVEPFYFQQSNVEAASIYFISTSMLVVFTTSIGLFVMEWDREDEKQPIYLLALFVALPIVVAFSLSWLLPHSVWGTRHLIIVLPPAMILIAYSIIESKVRWFRVITVALVVALSFAAFVADSLRGSLIPVWCSWNEVPATMLDRAGDRPTPVRIYAFEDLVAYHLWFASRDGDRFRVGLINDPEVNAGDRAYFLPRGFSDIETRSIDEVSDETLLLAFRLSPNDSELAVIEKFSRLGYQQCSSVGRSVGSTFVRWIELRKNSCPER